MARPIAALKPEVIDPAVRYLKRAADRRSDIFRHRPEVARRELVELEAGLTRLSSARRGEVLQSWLAKHVTDKGRVRMLNALRRAKADNAVGTSARRSLSLPASTFAELDALAKEVGGVPMTKLVAAFAAIGRADPALREQLLKLAVAMSVMP